MITKFILYSTLNCHLCENAELLLKQTNVEWRAIEIADNDDLLNLYGLKIPVLQNYLSKAELSWPFTQTDVERFCK
ncbi:MAG: glutaredoxin family protein [Methylophilaceae bacterium]|nr:glutaredoxin family protein [Methylophilaceae bacterium]